MFLKLIFILLSVSIFIKSYIFIIKKTNFNDFINYLINIKYTNKKQNISSKLVYNSLNKIVEFNDEMINEEPIKEIINVSKEEVKEEKVEEQLSEPIIYIYNTHDTEEYGKINASLGITPTVKIASYILKDHLNNYKINSTVEERKMTDYLKKNNLNYNDSYQASRYYMKEYIKKDNYKIFIDLHRDSIKRNLSVYEHDNKKYAKILFVIGTKHENYKYNDQLVKELEKSINKEYKGLSRGIMYKEKSIFNQDLSKNAILIEIGGVDNTIEEVNNTLNIIAKVLSEYIKKEFNEEEK